MKLQFAAAKLPGGHREAARANGFGAGNVLWSVADEDDLVGVQLMSACLRHAPQRKGAEMIAVIGVIPESAIRKKRVNAESLQLELGCGTHIAGQQSEVHLRIPAELREKFGHSIEKATGKILSMEASLEETKVELQKLCPCFGGEGFSHRGKEIAQHTAISGSGEHEWRQIPTTAGKHCLSSIENGGTAGTAGVQQRAVNIE